VEFKLVSLKQTNIIPLPEIPDSSKWSSNIFSLLPLKSTISPEIPDSSKWSSNVAGESGTVRSVSPEIPDSSKWSSNLFRSDLQRKEVYDS